MTNLLLLIIGKNEEEIRENANKALDEAFRLHRTMGKDANMFYGSHFEFEFVDDKTIADIMSNSNQADARSFRSKSRHF